MIEANNPLLKTWISVPSGSDFPIQNIPFGIANINGTNVAVSRIGNTVINLSKLFELYLFNGILN